MAVKFDFLSPGVLLREFDKSQLPAGDDGEGLIIIGNATKGPGNIPVRVRDRDTLEQLFGTPVPPNESADWRESSISAPTYGLYAAHAWLSQPTANVSFVRLIGEEHESQSSGIYAGWKTTGVQKSSVSDIADNGGAYGLFVFPSASALADNVTGTLAAIFYCQEGALRLSGASGQPESAAAATASVGSAIRSSTYSGAKFGSFTLEHINSATASYEFHLDTSTDTGYIRDALPSNPAQTNAAVTSVGRTSFFLGQSYGEMVNRLIAAPTAAGGYASGSAGQQVGVLVYMGGGGNFNYNNWQRPAEYARSGWFISHDHTGKSGYQNYSPTNQEKLFRFASLYKGRQIQDEILVQIEVTELATDGESYSRFNVSILNRATGANIISYNGCDLNPASANYIARKIGDQYFEWKATENKYVTKGDYANQSNHIRVEVSEAVKNGALDNKGAAPWGVEGPVTIADMYFTGTPNTAGDVTLMTDSSSGLDGLTILLTNTDGTTHEITVATGATTKSNVSKADSNSADAFASELKDALDLAAADGDIKMTVSSIGNDSAGNPRVITLTQTSGGSDSNKAITGTLISGNKIILNNTLNGGSHNDQQFTGGTGPANKFYKTHATAVTHTHDATFVGQAGAIIFGDASGGKIADFVTGKGKIQFPTLKQTTKSSIGSQNAVGIQLTNDGAISIPFGFNHVLSGAAEHHDSYKDLLLPGPYTTNGGGSLEVHTADGASIGTGYQYQYFFSLDDIVYDSGDDSYYYQSGSRAANNSDNLSISQGYEYMVQTKNMAKFVSPLFGGTDGVDITEPNPFNNRILSGDGTAFTSSKKNYAVYSFNKALDTIRDPEVVTGELLSAPGVTNTALTDEIMSIAAQRGDVLAVIDLEGGYNPKGDGANTATDGSIINTITKLRGRRLNTSYACAYYPWVKLNGSVVNGAATMAPPSVAGIGAMAGSDAVSFPWFAPAGFRRGGLSPLGASDVGLKVEDTEEHLTKRNRDNLYAININPIAKFPSSNDIVVFGQKTLQKTRSALDRINVRRMMLFIKKRIGRIADSFLFEQNIESTWASFRAQAKRVLDGVRAEGGITDYRLILDKTTTTPDLVDRNIMYAKVMVKPARSIEFIVVDFVITRSDAVL